MTPLQNTWEGVLSYALIKLIGYTLAALFLKRKYTNQTNVYLAGAFRTAMGVVFGLAYTTMAEALWWRYEWRQFFLVGLIPFRVIEWTIFIWLFFDRKFYDNLRAMRFVGLGIAWSFVLDFVALFFSLIAFGGRIWIC